MSYTLQATIERIDGHKKLEIKNLQTYNRMLDSFKEGAKVEITIEKQKNIRSSNQNRYYWKCMEVISGDTGHSSEELHTIFKGLYAPKKEKKLGARVYRIPISTTEMSVGVFCDYFQRIQAEAAGLGIILPDAKDYNLRLDSAELL